MLKHAVGMGAHAKTICCATDKLLLETAIAGVAPLELIVISLFVVVVDWEKSKVWLLGCVFLWLVRELKSPMLVECAFCCFTND